MPEVAICIENILILELGAQIDVNGERLAYPLEFFVQHLLFLLAFLIQPLLTIITVHDSNQHERDPSNAVCSGRLADLPRWISISRIQATLS
jgi:hypothetical protein